MRLVLAALAAICLSVAASAQPKGWIKDQERETSPGEYATFKGEQNGWQLWVTENRDGRECRAYKGAAGAELPKPSPVWFTLHDLRVAQISRFGSSFGPGAARVHREYRVNGERFFTDFKDPGPSWSEFEGKTLQFRIVGFNHYSRDMNWVDLDFEIDMSGARDATAWVEACK